MHHDDFTAPCPQDGLLSLAICKPAIRRLASIGSILVGIGGLDIGMGRLIYAAHVTDVIPAGPIYYEPTGPYFSRIDCVYYNANGQPKHRGEYYSHYRRNKTDFFNNDVGDSFSKARVLLSRNFVYLGAEGTADRLIAYKPLHPAVTWSRQHWPLTKDSTPAAFEALLHMLGELWGEKSGNYVGEPTHSRYDDELIEWKKANSYRLRRHNDHVRRRLR